MFSPDVCDALNSGKVSSAISEALAATAKKELRRFTLGLVRAVASGALRPDKAPAAFHHSAARDEKDLLTNDSIIADTLWFVWLESEGSAAADQRKNRLADFGKAAMKGSLVTKRRLMEVSEGDFMESSGLIVNYRDGWRKKEIRSNTRNVYTQRKFNLLREESEGYAKLVTLLNQAGSGSLQQCRADAALGELKALIGYFDLDPNRVCSLVLDAFATQPWNNAFLRLLPAFSSEALAQLLGFHFSRESMSPAGLYSIAAVMIKDGYVSLEQVLSHFLVSDAEMAGSWKEGVALMEKAVKGIGVISLTQGTESAPGGEAGENNPGHQPRQMKRTGQTAAVLELDPRPFALHAIGLDRGASNQRIRLLAALLKCGAWNEAIWLIKWLSGLGIRDLAIFPAVGGILCQLLSAEIEPLKQQLYPGGKQAELVAGKLASKQTPKLDALELSDRALELLLLLGHHLYHDVATLTWLTRIVGAALDWRCPSREAAKEILNSHILPATALIPSNAALVLEVWNAMSRLDYTERFCLYSELKEAKNDSLLLAASAKLAETEVRRILRRVTAPANKREARQTMRPLGRMLAKIMHANPLGVSEQLLRQVMGMPGMVISIHEALNFLTPLAFDVATFAIIRELASGKRKLKEDGINLEEWFQWLAAFTGLLCRKHDEVELTALLQYIANQLKGCESLDLLVLKEIVSCMSGVSPVFDISDGQLDALAGSDTLVMEVMAQGGGGGRNDRAAQQGMQRLLAALQVGSLENQLAIPLLILLAQQRKLITLQPQSFHLKLVAELYDKCHEVAMQYVEFLKKALAREQYATLLPSIADLALKYRVDPEIIFELHRPLIRGICPPALPVPDAAAQIELMPETGMKPEDAADVPKDQSNNFAMEDDEEGEIAGGDVSATVHLEKPGEARTMDVEDGEVPAVLLITDDCEQIQWGGAAWEGLVAQTASLSPYGGFRGMSQTLFVTFWALSLYDLHVPTARYEMTMSQVKTNARMARDDLEAAKRESQRGYGGHGHGGYGMQPPPPPPPSEVMDGLANELDRLDAVLKSLSRDLEEQEAAVAVVDARLMATRGAWILESNPESQAAAAREFVQFCVLPRVLNSPADALYCARFLRKAHALGPPGFMLLAVMDRLFRELGFLVRCCTAREATNMGIFFADFMALVTGWRDPSAYASQCANSEVFRSYKGGELQAVSHSEFVKLSANWHRKITLDVFKTCLASADYMQMKNALLVLNRTVRIYPATREDAAELLRTLMPIRNSDPREDLKILARMYCTALEMALRDQNRPVVDTRQEYAGLPPPSRKKRSLAKPKEEELKEQTQEEIKKKRFLAKPKEETREEEHESESGDRRRRESIGERRDAEKSLTSGAGKIKTRHELRQSDRKDDTRSKDRCDDLGKADRAGGGTAAQESKAPRIASGGRSDRPVADLARVDSPRPGRQRDGTLRDDRCANLRVDAKEYVPVSSKDSGRGRPAEEPTGDRQRDPKRQHKDVPLDTDKRENKGEGHRLRSVRGRDDSRASSDPQDSTKDRRGLQGRFGGTDIVQVARAAAQEAQNERARSRREEGRRKESNAAGNIGRGRTGAVNSEARGTTGRIHGRSPDAAVPTSVEKEQSAPDTEGRKHSRYSEDGEGGDRYKRRRTDMKDRKRACSKSRAHSEERRQSGGGKEAERGDGVLDAPSRLRGRLGSVTSSVELPGARESAERGGGRSSVDRSGDRRASRR